MTNSSRYIALEINGDSICLQQVLRFAKSCGQSTFINDAIDAALIRQEATKRNIRVSDEEFQLAADSFRTQRDLYSLEATEDWLASNCLSHAEWEAQIEDEIIRVKLCDVLTGGSVEKYFTEQRLSFDAATISRLVLKEEGVARELRAQIIEDGADFHALAREYSIDLATRPAGGYSGLVRRSEMVPVMEAAVFGAQPGQTIGPLKTSEGWALVKLEILRPATLDDAMRKTIKSILFSEWLRGQRLEARISIPLLDAQAEELEPTTKSATDKCNVC